MQNGWKEKTENLVQGLKREVSLAVRLEAEKLLVVIENALQQGFGETKTMPNSASFELQMKSFEY